MNDLYLQNVTNSSPSTTSTLSLPTGHVVLYRGTPSENSDINEESFNYKLSARSVAAGNYPVDAYLLDDDLLDDLNASAGLTMVVVSFSDEKITTWEEVVDKDGDQLLTFDEYEFLLFDKENTGQVAELESTDIQHAHEECFSGEGIATINDGLVLLSYIGEDCTSHNLYWGLDANNHPAKLVAYFEYRGATDHDGADE